MYRRYRVGLVLGVLIHYGFGPLVKLSKVALWSLYKVPKTVLHSLESIRRNFFNGIREGDRKISWIRWPKVLASRENGGLGVSSFYALNRGLLAKWMWRFLSNENSLWVRFIKAAHGDTTHNIVAAYPSPWNTNIKELHVLKSLGFDFFSHCKIRIRNMCNTSFWKDPWIGDSSIRGGIESSQFSQIFELLGTLILSSMEDRWRWDLNGDGYFHVKDVRSKLDDSLLPKVDTPTRWIKTIPIKLNIFAWKVSLNSLPTRLNLVWRGVLVSPISCPIYLAGLEDLDHLLFRFNMAAETSGLANLVYGSDLPLVGSGLDWHDLLPFEI
nr:hypothetical protein [Tanacetum cinerariifolium]